MRKSGTVAAVSRGADELRAHDGGDLGAPLHDGDRLGAPDPRAMGRARANGAQHRPCH
jgi:hypothetical protein